MNKIKFDLRNFFEFGATSLEIKPKKFLFLSDNPEEDLIDFRSEHFKINQKDNFWKEKTFQNEFEKSLEAFLKGYTFPFIFALWKDEKGFIFDITGDSGGQISVELKEKCEEFLREFFIF